MNVFEKVVPEQYSYLSIVCNGTLFRIISMVTADCTTAATQTLSARGVFLQM